jgi:hypothetical protein
VDTEKIIIIIKRRASSATTSDGFFGLGFLGLIGYGIWWLLWTTAENLTEFSVAEKFGSDQYWENVLSIEGKDNNCYLMVAEEWPREAEPEIFERILVKEIPQGEFKLTFPKENFERKLEFAHREFDNFVKERYPYQVLDLNQPRFLRFWGTREIEYTISSDVSLGKRFDSTWSAVSMWDAFDKAEQGATYGYVNGKKSGMSLQRYEIGKKHSLNYRGHRQLILIMDVEKMFPEFEDKNTRYAVIFDDDCAPKVVTNDPV